MNDSRNLKILNSCLLIVTSVFATLFVYQMQRELCLVSQPIFKVFQMPIPIFLLYLAITIGAIVCVSSLVMNARSRNWLWFLIAAICLPFYGGGLVLVLSSVP
jgi:hypothetical protein